MRGRGRGRGISNHRPACSRTSSPAAAPASCSPRPRARSFRCGKRQRRPSWARRPAPSRAAPATPGTARRARPSSRRSRHSAGTPSRGENPGTQRHRCESTAKIFVASGRVHRDEQQAAVVERRVVQRDPQRESAAVRRVAVVEAPVRIVEVPASWIGPRLLDQRLIVPDADALHAR